MQEKYIMPTVGQIYTNRNGKQYRCTGNRTYPDEVVMQRALETGEHTCTMVRLTDGWTIKSQGVFQYADGSIEWRHSTNGSFAADSLARCWKSCGTAMFKYFQYLDDLRDSGEVNMFFAVPSLQKEFLELGFDYGKAKLVHQAWRDSYKDHGEEIEN